MNTEQTSKNIFTNINNIYKNTEEYNQNKKQKKFVIFDYMIADVHNNEKLN